LDGSGSDLWIDIDSLLAAEQPLMRKFQESLDTAQKRAISKSNWQQKPGTSNEWTLSFEGTWESYYARSGDWFYALGGFSYAYEAYGEVKCKDGKYCYDITFKWHTFDKYNWDQEKAIKIGPVTITDKSIGRLHKVGLAREYIARGYKERGLDWCNGAFDSEQEAKAKGQGQSDARQAIRDARQSQRGGTRRQRRWNTLRDLD
jgi:hypothetical protein